MHAVDRHIRQGDDGTRFLGFIRSGLGHMGRVVRKPAAHPGFHAASGGTLAPTTRSDDMTQFAHL